VESPNFKYIPGIDHLRGFAALLIVLYHGLRVLGWDLRFHTPAPLAEPIVANNPLSAIVVEGHTAVALFMVLSGLIFTLGAGQDAVRYGPFLRNRVLRIYPLFLFVMLVGAVFEPHHLTVTGVAQTLLCLGNLPGAVDLGPFSSMFWTVAIEFQFYVLFPLLHQLLLRHGPLALMVLLGLAAGARLILWMLGVGAFWLSYFTLLGRIDQFLLGMTAGWFYARRRWSRPRLRWGLAPAAVTVVVALFVFNRLGGWPANTWWNLAWPSAEGAMWAAVVPCYLATAELLGPRVSRALTAFGVISYSVYLLHFPIIHLFVARRWWLPLVEGPQRNSIANTLLIILPVVTLVATATYHLVERPFLRLRTRYLAASRA